MKILFIINKLKLDSGGAVINNRNLSLLQNVYGEENIVIYEFEKNNKNRNVLYCKYLSFFGGISNEILNDIHRFVKDNDIKIVFVSNSTYGLISKKINSISKQVVIITFFHNVEYLYIKDLFKFSKLKSRYFLPFFIKRVERMSVDNSDIIIALNDRDSDKLYSIYGRKADFLLPTSLEGINIKTAFLDNNFTDLSNDLELLFVGSNFYANIHGINWFINNVMTKIENVKLTIVGNGLNDQLILKNKNITVYGRVESLDSFYKNAQIVVMPIFLGSGMKTKTAEALMYGRPILATSEALEGYNIKNINLIGAQCDSEEKFVEQINYFKKNKKELFDKGINSRKLFLDNYSNDAIINLFKRTVYNKVKELIKIRYV